MEYLKSAREKKRAKKRKKERKKERKKGQKKRWKKEIKNDQKKRLDFTAKKRLFLLKKMKKHKWVWKIGQTFNINGGKW